MNRKILLGILILAFLGYAGYSFVDSVTPYVGIAEAHAVTSAAGMAAPASCLFSG